MSNSLTEGSSVRRNGCTSAARTSHTGLPRGVGLSSVSSAATAIGFHRYLVRPLVRMVSIAATLIVVVAPALWPSAGLAAASPPLRQLGKGKHLFIGSAVRSSALANEADYAAVLAREFSSVTPEFEMFWGVLEPTQGVVDYSGADAIVTFARAHGQRVRGYPLVWSSGLPNWLTQGVANGTISSAQLSDILHQHITQVVSHFRGRVNSWDVVNEPLNEDGTLRATIWLQQLGPGYIAQALRWAHEADPKPKLYINDFNIEGAGAKSDAMLALVKNLKADGVPINGVGFEAHLGLQFSFPTDMQQNLARFGALHVQVAITEADVRMILPATPELLAAQASYFVDLLQACRSVRQCKSFTLWEYTDRWSWVPGFFTGQGAATPFDENLQPKPAYFALSNALRGQ